MAIFKCKICGGTLEINTGETVATCEYCGTKQTLPKLDDERKANLFDRANHFRRNNDFDKAMGMYEQILNEDTGDAESYWSIVLCRYGIEYVEDPSSHKRVPTVNRAQFTSVFDDEDYKSAIKYADSYQKNIYESEAAVINEIQKGILAISQKEEPFDVFICYKETDNNGRRTQDSVLATELYHELTKDGFKVFFSRITLEDKLGVAYEPYIFAALNSAKVMVALGTKPEHFNAVWVKNEWSRYLSLIKNGANKILIPAYRDMDPYDLPEEFSHLQAQDMSKLGFMQDLVRGIKKLVSTDNSSGVKETVVVQSTVSGNASALVKRGFLALEDGEWEKADNFFEQALNQNAEDAQAYLGKLMAELQVKVRSALKDCVEPFDKKNMYQKVIRFGDSKLKSELEGYIAFINDRNEKERLKRTYAKATQQMNTAITEDAFKTAAATFSSIKDYMDSKELSEKCLEKSKNVWKDEILRNANSLLNGSYHWKGMKTSLEDYINAVEQLQKITGYMDADEKVIVCQKKIDELKAKAEEERIEYERQLEKEKIEQEKIRVEQEHKNEAKRLEEQKQKKTVLIIRLSILGLASILVVFFIIFSNNYSTKVYKEINELIDNKQLTEEMCNWNNKNDDTSYYAYLDDNKGKKLIIAKLDKYCEENDIESALWLYSMTGKFFYSNSKKYSLPEKISTYIIDYAKQNGKMSSSKEYRLNNYRIIIGENNSIEVSKIDLSDEISTVSKYSSPKSEETHKSNLDWIPYDNNPNDNEFDYYKIELEGSNKNYHYLLNINKDNDTIGGSKTLYENEWSRYEGGRIFGRVYTKQAITWTNSDKTSGEFTMHTKPFKFQISNNTLIITALGEDDDNLAGTYKQAQSK